jgi:uncharacterized protein Usg
MSRQIPLFNKYCLATTEILYWLPDHPSLLQAFVWQTMDLAPDFPSIQKFLQHWEKNIEARIHSIKVGSRALLRPAEFRRVDQVWTLH